MKKNHILLFFEQHSPLISYRILAKAQQLAEEMNSDVHLVTEYLPEESSYEGVSKIYVSSPCRNSLLSFPYVSFVCEAVKRCSPSVLLFPATKLGKSLSARVAARLGCGLTADCVDLKVGKNGLLKQISPAFSGNALVSIYSPESPVQIATVLESVLLDKVSRYPKNIKSAIIEKIPVNCDLDITCSPKKVQSSSLLDDAQTVFCAGFGISSSENFRKLERLASLMPTLTAVGATLAAVNAGFAPADLLIGQTGRHIYAKTYVGFGVSGQLQHTMGITVKPELMVSVNTDSSAPLNYISDVVVSGDCGQVIDKMIAKMEMF